MSFDDKECLYVQKSEGEFWIDRKYKSKYISQLEVNRAITTKNWIKNMRKDDEK